ncbi:uncharacterized protein GBIM_07669 [Gryllus bimaculatus]|nr:uncharacterized protein GBIM_07669 [Gryllus bimaculatus]
MNDYRLFCIMVSQRYIPTRDSGEPDIFSYFFGAKGPNFSRQNFKHLTAEEWRAVRQDIDRIEDRALQVLRDIPSKLLLVLSCENLIAEIPFSFQAYNVLPVTDYQQLAEILTQSPLRIDFQLRTRLTEEDMKYMTDVARERFDKIMAALRDMPRNLLLVVRNLNTIRAIAREHGDPTDRYTVMARSATQGAFASPEAGLRQRLAGWRERCYFEFRLWVAALRLFFLRTFFRVLQVLGRSPDLSAIMNEPRPALYGSMAA